MRVASAIPEVSLDLVAARLERCPPEGFTAGDRATVTPFFQVPGAASRFIVLPRCEAVEHEHANVQISVPFTQNDFHARWHSSAGASCERVIRAGECCVVPSGQPHRFQFRESAEFVSLYLEPAWLEHAAEESVGPGAWYLPGDYQCQDPVLLQLGEALREAYHTAPAPPRMLLEGAAAVAAMRLLRRKSAGQRVKLRNDQLSSRALRQALDYIQEHLGEDLSLVSIATAAECSPFHFARAFKAAVGLSPHGFVTRSRIEEAKRRLRDGDMTIGSIGADCGFRNPGHFARIFRRFTGWSPRSYRQRGKG